MRRRCNRIILARREMHFSPPALEQALLLTMPRLSTRRVEAAMAFLRHQASSLRCARQLSSIDAIFGSRRPPTTTGRFRGGARVSPIGQVDDASRAHRPPSSPPARALAAALAQRAAGASACRQRLAMIARAFSPFIDDFVFMTRPKPPS